MTAMTGSAPGQAATRRSSPRIAPALLSMATATVLLFAGACASGRHRQPPGPGSIERGVASWYGPRFHGRQTANGERYDMHRLTAAHKKLAFGTVVEVTNLDNGRRVEVRINDRGPFVKRRILDLSQAAADAIGMLGTGTAQIEMRILRAPPPPRYTVQVGAFEDAERARALAEDLRQRYPETVVTSDGTWHRVQVGAYGRRSQAEETSREIAGQGLTSLVVSLPEG